MSDTGTRMLATIRRALGRDTGEDPELVEQERARMMATSAPRPDWQESTEARFLAHLEAAAATWERIASTHAIPDAACRALVSHDRPSIRLGDDPLLQGLTWPAEVDVGNGLDGARTATATITVARAGIAETGTLVLASGAANPTSLNFLAEHHFVLLRAEAIVSFMEDAWARLLAQGAPPRAVNFITGPSRTGDVEQTIELGAHGPRSVHVLLLARDSG